MLSGNRLYILIFFGFIAVAVAALVFRDFRRSRLRRSGILITASVIEVGTERILRGDATDRDRSDAMHRFLYMRKYTYTFYYTVGEQSYVPEIKHESEEQTYRQGDKVDIYYNPANPNEMLPAAEVNSGTPALGPLGPMLVIILGILLFFFIKG